MLKKYLLAALLTAVLLLTMPGCSPKSCIIEVSVTDGSGQPIPGAEVTTVNQPEGQLQLAAATGQDGLAVFKGVKPGSYRINIQYSDFIPRAMEFTLKGGQSFTAEFILSKNEPAPFIPTYPTYGEEHA